MTLAAEFSQAVEEDAGREWHDEDKEEHLTEDAARFLVVRDNSGAVVGFAHFRFTLHGELAGKGSGSTRPLCTPPAAGRHVRWPAAPAAPAALKLPSP